MGLNIINLYIKFRLIKRARGRVSFKAVAELILNIQGLIKLCAPQRKMPVHMMKKMAPNPAKTEAKVAATSSFTRLLCSLGLLTRYLKPIVIRMLHAKANDIPLDQ